MLLPSRSKGLIEVVEIAIQGYNVHGRALEKDWFGNHRVDHFALSCKGPRLHRTDVGLNALDRRILADILDSGPVAYGFLSGLWTSPMVARVIAEEVGVSYHPGHVCRLLHALGFSVQRPQRLLIRADPREQAHWRQHVYPGIKAASRQGTALVFE